MSRIKKELQIKPDWKKVNELCEASEYSIAQISTILGKSDRWIYDGTKRDSVADINTLTGLATLLKVSRDELVKREPKEDSKEEPKEGSSKNSEVALMHKIMEVEAKVDRIIELLATLSQSEPSEPKEDGKYTFMQISKFSKNDRAKFVLKELLEEGFGKCLYTNFTKALVALDIGTSYADQAIKDCLCQKGTTGYGNNTVTWILNPYWEGENNGK